MRVIIISNAITFVSCLVIGYIIGTVGIKNLIKKIKGKK